MFCRADGSPHDPGSLRNKVLYPALDAAKIRRSSRTHGFHPSFAHPLVPPSSILVVGVKDGLAAHCVFDASASAGCWQG